jgi:hypothetical protein
LNKVPQVRLGGIQVSIKQVDRKTITVTLERPGAGTKVVELTQGSTIADLLRQTEADACHSHVFIGDKDLTEYVVLEEGMTVFLVPRPNKAADDVEGGSPDRSEDGDRNWRDLMGDFHDDPAFEEVMRIVEAERKAEKVDG